MLNDPLANALSKILNAEKLGRNACTVKPSSRVVKEVLGIMKDSGFIGEFKETDDKRGGFIEIALLGKINKCGVVKPRYSAKKDEFERFEARYLPAKDFGILIVSTPKGIMTQNKAKENNEGGVLLAYCY